MEEIAGFEPTISSYVCNRTADYNKRGIIVGPRSYLNVVLSHCIGIELTSHGIP